MKLIKETFTRRDLAKAAALALPFAQAAPRAFAQAAPKAKPEPITGYVADFILATKYEDIPGDVLALARKSILDGFGLALAGSVAETGSIVRQYLQAQGVAGNKGATLIGSSIKTPARFAAFANGVGIHADDYDDTQLAVAQDRTYGLLMHPTAPALPPVLALAEIKGMSGRDMLLAYNVGVEVECKIAEAISPRHYEDGFHTTGTVGALGSAAASAKLLNYNRDQVLRSLGIAASEGAGLRENFGTMTKPFHAGRAAESGVVAADLAGLGWTATDHVLEAERGFFHAAGGGFDQNAIWQKLGKPWTFANPGVSIKPFPSGSLSHPGMTEMERLIKEHGIRGDQVESVDVGVNKNTLNALLHHDPKDHLQAKFSMEFCMTTLLLYGKGGLTEFTDEVVNRPAVQQMISRVKVAVDPISEAAGYNKMTTLIHIHMKGGKTISGRADFAKGSPSIPMSYDDVAAKFMDCAAFAKWPIAKAKQVVEITRKLEDVRDIHKLTGLLG